MSTNLNEKGNLGCGQRSMRQSSLLANAVLSAFRSFARLIKCGLELFLRVFWISRVPFFDTAACMGGSRDVRQDEAYHPFSVTIVC